jgi:hypothetical protein
VILKLHCRTLFLIALALGVAGVCAAQAQSSSTPAAPPATKTVTAEPATPAATATVRGHVADPSGAMIPGAAITITTSAGKVMTNTTADASGHYEASDLAPGSYIVHTTVEGFAPFTSPAIPLAAGQVKRVDITMAMVVEQQSVVVTAEEDVPTVSVEAGGNASAVVIKGKDLEALSDDPDELSSELTALAGPSAGPNGGQIYIDGFTGGQLPPKSAIREIRINQNPFSAEFDHIGYGRIEILTKPGTDKLHGRFFGQGNDDLFNTGNPFTKVIPAYHSYQINGSVNGSLSKKASFFISVEERDNQNASIYSANTAALVADPSRSCGPTTSGACQIGPISGGLFSPSTHTEVSPRIDLQLGQKNTLTLRYQFYRNSQSGNIGSTSLPSQSTTSTSMENSIQLSDSQIISEHVVNETRFQYLRDITSNTPDTALSDAPTVTVPQAFTGGAASSQNSHDHTDHLELQNMTTMSVGAQAIKFGMRVRDNREANSTDANFNGTFSFPSLQAYVATLNGMMNPNYLTNGQVTAQTFVDIANACPPTQTGGCLPNNLSYTTGTEGVLANVFDAALFFQDDWKANANLTLSGGLRWESQNHVADHDDWAPRVAFAYALDGHKDKTKAKTVLRGGYGFFYDRLGVGNLLPAKRYSGGAGSQTQFSITDPTCFSATSLSAALQLGCGAATSSTQKIVQISPTYHSPYMEQLGASLERQLTKTTTFTLTFLHSYGVHQMATRDSNAYLPGTFLYGSSTLTGVRPNPALGIVDETFPEAIFKQNQVIVNINARLTPKFSLMGFYNLNYANADTGTASNSYNLLQDYHRANFASRNMVFLMANYTAHWNIVFNPFLIAQSSKPYNVVTPYDLTGDAFFNNRPSIAASSSSCNSTPSQTSTQSQYVQTSFGCLDTIPQAGETILPDYIGNGPAAVAVNLRVSRSFGVGPKLAPANGQNNAGGPPPGGPPPGGGPGGGGRGGPGGGPGGGFGPGGFGGGGGGRGGMFGQANTGHKYSLTFSAQALNLFNDIDYGQPAGNVTSPNFGKSTSLAGGIFSSGSAARRIFFQAVFQF